MGTTSNRLRLGVDLGGTKIEAAILDTAGDRLCHRRTPTPGTYAQILASVRDLCDSVEREVALPHRSLPLGIGTPGSESPATGLMRNCNSTCLNGRALRADLQHRAGRPVRSANDADCFTLSESRDGAAAGAGSVFGIILGTGVGGGLCVNGDLLAGPNRLCGEWGHNPMPLERVHGLPESFRASRRLCYCGRENCIETWLSGPGLAQTHRDLHHTDIDTAQLHGGNIHGPLRETINIYIRMLAAGLAAVINIVDPQVIVIGGGLSRVQALYTSLPETIAAQVFSDSFSTPIRQAQHGDSSGVRGAAWLWEHES